MSFARHRQKQELPKEVVIEIKKEEVRTKTDPELYVQINPEEKKPIKEKPVIVSEVQKEEIEPVIKKERKEREDTKIYTNVGITGDTPDVRDFRAIVKKKGDQINMVLTNIIRTWNSQNYNL